MSDRTRTKNKSSKQLKGNKKVGSPKSNPSNTNKEKLESRKTYTKKQLQVRVGVVILIGIFVSLGLLSSWLYYSKSVSIVFKVDKDKINTKNYDSIELLWKYNGEIQSYKPSDKAQKIPKTAQIIGFKIVKVESTSNESDYFSYSVAKNFTFESYQNEQNVIYEKGNNYKNVSNFYKSSNRYYTEKYIYFSFNQTYNSVKNASISYSFYSNESISGFNVQFYNFKSASYENIYTTSSKTKQNINYPILYLNNSISLINKTYFILKFVGYKTNDKYYGFTVRFANLTAYFWKQYDHFSYTNTTNLKINSEISVINSIDIKENEYIFSTIVNESTFISCGSWNTLDSYIYNSSIIVREQIQSFDIKNIDLMWDSGLGLRELDIKLNDINMDNHKIDYDLAFTSLALY